MEYDDAYLRNPEIGVLYHIIYEGNECLGYRNVDGKWVLYNPEIEENGKIIKPETIGPKRQFVSKLQVSKYKKSSGSNN